METSQARASVGQIRPNGSASPDATPQTFSLRDHVRALAQGWSLEVTPRESEKLEPKLTDHLPEGTPVYVTWLAGSEFSLSVAAAARLRRLGMEPVPHLAARAIPDEKALDNMLRQLRGEANVQQVLLVGGALSHPVGRFNATMPVLETDLFRRHEITRVGVAAHPEGSPDIPAAALAQALRDKNAYAARTTLALELTSQFCFDAIPIVRWEREVRDAGNALPIAIGLAGLAGVTTLIKHAKNCGVGNSIGVLLKQATKVLRLATAVDPSDVVLALARARQMDAGCLVRRLHFFPFGAFEATAGYARALAEGRFELDVEGTHLRVLR
jgi:methylenetetrahydrofolate reductase (NADPH)